MSVDARISHPLRRVAVLLGGRSKERDISLLTGKAVANALLRQNCLVDSIDWQGRDTIAQLLSGNYDCVFIALHGIDGEDGTVQSLLEILQIPYTGSGVLANALCMDKLRTKKILKACGLPVLPDLKLIDGMDSKFIVDTLGLPLCIKPVQQGSTLGVYKVTSLSEVKKSWDAALNYGDEIMAEPWLSGREYTVSLLNNKPLPSIWIEAKQEFYTYEAKYITGDTNYHCPSELTSAQEQEIQDLAKMAFDATGCADWGRVDFMTDDTGKFYILEVNTVPGLTNTSLVPKAAKSVNISFDALVLQITLNASLKQLGNLVSASDKQVIA